MVAIDEIYREYQAALYSGDRSRTLQVAQAALANGTDVREFYLEVLQPAMYEIGQRWERGQISIAEEHTATAITQGLMDQLGAWMATSTPAGRTVVATCVGSERHDVGIRMVADFFTWAGWQVIYLGANMPASEIVKLVNERQPDLLAVSVTLTSHLLVARNLIQAVRASPASSQIKVLVGGQPFITMPHLAASIGADCVGRDAREAVQQATLALGAVQTTAQEQALALVLESLREQIIYWAAESLSAELPAVGVIAEVGSDTVTHRRQVAATVQRFHELVQVGLGLDWQLVAADYEWARRALSRHGVTWEHQHTLINTYFTIVGILREWTAEEQALLHDIAERMRTTSAGIYNQSPAVETPR